jgi:hypothetical protein
MLCWRQRLKMDLEAFVERLPKETEVWECRRREIEPPTRRGDEARYVRTKHMSGRPQHRGKEWRRRQALEGT